jgi:hypothetical protein
LINALKLLGSLKSALTSAIKIRPRSFDTLDAVGGKRVRNSEATYRFAADVTASMIIARQLLRAAGLFFAAQSIYVSDNH